MSAPSVSGNVSGREFAKLDGCDEKQVRRGIASGKLTVDAKGNLDPSQVGNGWRRPRVDSRETPSPSVAKAAAERPKNVRAPPDGNQVAGVPVVSSPEGMRLKNAVAHKEDFAGRLKELEFRQRAGELIEIDVARRVLFDEFRAARDAWLNWPTRVAALIASDLGLEADRVAGVLTTYVHKQLATLGEPGGDFRKN